MNPKNLVYASGAVMAIVFLLNLYVALSDKNLNPSVTPHYYLNWMITITDIVAFVLLFLKPTKDNLVALSGVVWPLVYIGSLGIDIESRLCLGAPASTCFPSITDAENYLLFGSTSYVPVYYWPYTFALIIVLLLLVVGLTGIYFFLMENEKLGEAKV
ncbi:MAG: hypothetical protein ACYCQJ_09115 [Nitrososphaerales archaeon]